MVQSKLMPVVIRISRLRWRYTIQGAKRDTFYHVIGYDMKRLIVTDEKADRAYIIKWADVELIKSEVTISQGRPNTALISEMQLLRKALHKFSAAIPRMRVSKEREHADAART